MGEFVRRKHQEQGFLIAREIVDGIRKQKIVVAAVTPGGGKTALASEFAHELIRGNVVDFVAVVCPRDSLRSQMRDGFTDERRGLTLRIAADGNRGLGQVKLHDKAGYVTTYQAVGVAPKRHLKRFERERGVLILDEVHHIGDAEAWAASLAPLVSKAVCTLAMSGPMYRDDGKPIAFIPYGPDKKPIVDIRYTRRDALAERAILPISVKLCDGQATYWHSYKRHQVTVSEATRRQEPKALKTLLMDSRYRHHVILDALHEWERYRSAYYRSRAIVICHDQDASRLAAHYIRENMRAEVTLAISDAGQKARRDLRRFREGTSGDVLVTCQMAYEGLDVPDVTHLVCLTDIRSTPWLDQALARATRFDSRCGLSWDQQSAYLYVPDDPSMVEYLDKALDDQDDAYRTHTPGLPPGPRNRRSTFEPVEGEAGVKRYGDINGAFGEQDNTLIERVKSDWPELACHPAPTLLKLGRQLYGDDGDPQAA